MGSYDTLNETEKSQLWLKHIEFDKGGNIVPLVLKAISQELIEEGIILKGFRLADSLYCKDEDDKGYKTWVFQHDKRNMHQELWHTKRGNKTYYYGKLMTHGHMEPLNKLKGFKFLPLLQQRHKN